MHVAYVDLGPMIVYTMLHEGLFSLWTLSVHVLYLF